MGRMLFLGAQLLFNILFIRLLGPHGNGQLALLTTNAALLVLIVGQGMDAALVYDIARQRQTRASRMRYLYSLFWMQALIICVFSLLFQYFTGYSYFGFTNSWGLVYAVTLLLNNYGVALWNGEKRFRVVYEVLILIYVCAFLLLGVMYLLGKHLSETALLKFYVGMSISSGVGLVGKYLYSYRTDLHFTLIPVSVFQKEWLRFGQLVFWANLFQYLAYRMDIWMVAAFLDKNQLGVYALAEKIIQTLWMVPSSLATVVFAYADRTEDPSWLAQFQTLLRIVIGCFVVADGLLFLSGHYLITRFWGKAFQDSVIPLWILLPGASLFVLNILLAAYFAARNKLQFNLVNAALCCIVILLCDLWWIPKNGITGAAWASSLGYGISGVCACMLFLRMHHLSWRTLFRGHPGEVRRLFQYLLR
ncbi:Membrane protein involved in the export of O-antigen and teichoic acid [Thermoflavifilum thermophilum]|uniref:Membrane protein involved in the export of O-antigen and teichoic acid n=2 Tax=Thermoflavifilum thermophilum TaxID=1393122 RepID=A0A1I7N3K4_9BACT|nr:Membrane protein involved in the export of O-antigen and teichoic acid [Thermoflavifilum thermophilum]